MKVFIFGAGASRGSQGLKFTGLKSPLMNDLADTTYFDIASFVGLSVESLTLMQIKIAESQISLEEYLTKRWNKINSLKTEPAKQAERKFFGLFTYYLWLLLQKVSETYNDANNENIYGEFIKKLLKKDENFGFINFNYDTLLDQAYQNIAGVTLTNHLSWYQKHNYIKPHGSVNWFLQPRIEDPQFLGESNIDISARFNRASSLIFNPQPISMDNMIVVDPKHNDLTNPKFIASSNFSRQYTYPLILLPLTTKQYSWVRNFSDKIISSGQELLSKAKEIYLIGYRAQDEIIQDLLANVQAGTPINFVGFNEDKGILSNIVERQPLLQRGRNFLNGFKDFVESY